MTTKKCAVTPDFLSLVIKRTKPKKYLQFEFLNTILKKAEFLEPSWEAQNVCTATKQGIVFKQSANSILVFSLNWHDWSVTALPRPRWLPLVERDTYIIVGMSPGVSFPWNSLLLFSSGFPPSCFGLRLGQRLKNWCFLAILVLDKIICFVILVYVLLEPRSFRPSRARALVIRCLREELWDR